MKITTYLNHGLLEERVLACGCIVANIGITGLQNLLLHNAAIDTSIVGNELEGVPKGPPYNVSSHLALIILKSVLDGINLHKTVMPVTADSRD